MKNPWITKESWLNRQSFTCKVPFKDFTMDGVLYDIDVPGYDKIELHPAARFIGTMNYGYAGTKELNEALVSRFLVIQMPDQNEETLEKIFTTSFPEGKPEAIEQFIGLSGSAKKGGERRNIHKSSGSSRNPCFVAGNPPGTETVSGCEDGCDQ